MATKSGKVRSLSVRPIQSADLAFEVPGVISFQGVKAQLGERVEAYSLEEKIYQLLGTKNDGDGKEDIGDGLFKYDAEAILQELNESLLYSLISGSLRASLKQTILLRANGYLEKYYAVKDIQDFYNDVYLKERAGNDTTTSVGKDKISRLTNLSDISLSKHQDLKNVYGAEARVVTENSSTTKSIGDTDKTTSEVHILPTASKTIHHEITVDNQTHKVPDVSNISGKSVNGEFKTFNEKDDKPTLFAEETITTHKTNQETTTTLVDYKHPSKDASIDYQRLQLDLQDELLKHQISLKKVKNLTSIMNNELKLLDLDIAKLQHSFLQTILVSPISGIVTAIYKDKGETVSPGEPVIRVENDEELLIVGFIQFRGLLKVGQTAELATKMFEMDETKKIPGKIVSIRGHDSDDDEWDVIIRCQNPDKSIPLNYQFDKDNTEISIQSVL